jgi:ABC-type nitrate/sulfonate/bicarbonate transport system permease component
MRATVGEAVLGFLVAAATGALSGLLINRSALMRGRFNPWLVVSRPSHLSP